jgi:hypothetical protein
VLGVAKVKPKLTLDKETLSFLNETVMVAAVEVEADGVGVVNSTRMELSDIEEVGRCGCILFAQQG